MQLSETLRGPRQLLILGAVAISGALAIQQGFLLPIEVRLARYTDWSPALSVLTLAMFVCISIWHQTGRSRRALWLDMLFAAAIVGGLTLLIPGRALIEADASLMASTSFGVYFTGTALAPIAGVYSDVGDLVVLEATLDKRGTLFPTMMAMVHAVSGVDADNGIVVSTACAWACLVLVIRIARRKLDTGTAWLAAILLAAFPLFSVHARSGTFDIPNLLFLLFFLHIGTSFILRGDRRSFWLMVAAAANLAQLRHEAGALAGLVVAVASVRVVLRHAPLLQLSVLLVPWLFVPAAWRRALPFNYELPPGRDDAWAFDYFLVNAMGLGRHFYSGVGPTQTGNGLVYVLAAAGIFLVFLRFFRGKKELVAWGYVATGILIITAIQLCYFWGTMDIAQTVRYFLPLHALLALIAADALSRVPMSRVRSIAGAWLYALFALGISLPYAIGAPEFARLTLSANTDLIQQKLQQSELQCGGVIRTPRALPLLLRGFSLLPDSLAASVTKEQLETMANRPLTLFYLPDLYVTRPDELSNELPSSSPQMCPLAPRGLTLSTDPPPKYVL